MVVLLEIFNSYAKVSAYCLFWKGEGYFVYFINPMIGRLGLLGIFGKYGMHREVSSLDCVCPLREDFGLLNLGYLF